MNSSHTRILRLAAIGLLLLLSCPLAAQAQVTLDVDHVKGARGSEIEIPISVRDAQELGPVQFELTYDPEVLEAVGVEAGSMLNGLAASFIPAPGQMNIGTITNQALTGEGELVKAKFRVVGGSGSETVVELENPLAFQYGRLVDLLVDADNGSFRVNGIPWLIPLIVASLLLLLATLLFVNRRRRARGRVSGLQVLTEPVTSPAFAEQERAVFCRQCGTALETVDRFCGGCGQSLAS